MKLRVKKVWRWDSDEEGHYVYKLEQYEQGIDEWHEVPVVNEDDEPSQYS